MRATSSRFSKPARSCSRQFRPFTAGQVHLSMLSILLSGAFLTKSACPIRALTAGRLRDGFAVANKTNPRKLRARKVENQRLARAVVNCVWISVAQGLGAHAAL